MSPRKNGWASAGTRPISAVSNSITVTVLAFARIRELLGAASQALQVEDGASVADVWDALASRYAALSDLAGSTRIARNGRVIADANERVHDGDELALLPPVGGG